MIMVGMISRVILPKVACANIQSCCEFCGIKDSCTNYAYPRLVSQILPQGLKGLLLAVMLSAMMSSLTSIFNSAATLFSVDLWAKVKVKLGREKPSARELVWVGRIFILVVIGISIAWIPIIQASNDGQL